MNKLINGDCLETLKNLGGGTVDLVVTDPPYVIETSGGGICGKDGIVKQFKEHDLDKMKDGFDTEVLDELCRVMKKINIYFFCSQKQIMPLYKYFVDGKKCNWNILSWHKSNPVPACGNKYLTDTEFIMFFREKGVKVYGTFDTKRTWYVSPTNQKEKKLYHHPTVKPVGLVENLIFNSSNEKDIVLDCFMGSGTTGVACNNLNRDFIGIEIDSEYFEIAKNRINNNYQQLSMFD